MKTWRGGRPPDSEGWEGNQSGQLVVFYSYVIFVFVSED